MVVVPAVEGLRLHLDPLVRRSQIWYHPLVRPSRLFITDIFLPNWDDLVDNLRYILQSKLNQDSIRKEQPGRLELMVLKTGGSRWSLPSSGYGQADVRYNYFCDFACETSDFGRFCCFHLQTRIKTLLAMLGCQLTMIYTDCC